MVKRTFEGRGWKDLHKALFDIPEQRAYKACLETALFLRMLDDKEDISARLIVGCGTLIMKDGSQKTLPFREAANKMIHSSRLKWKFSRNDDPVLICHTRAKEKWLRAEVNVVALALVCGEFVGSLVQK